MTKGERELMFRLAGRVQLALDSNQKLRSECERLREELIKQKELYSECKADCEKWKAQYEDLKFAKVMSVTDQEAAQTKRRLSKLVREIDDCISLLNE